MTMIKLLGGLALAGLAIFVFNPTAHAAGGGKEYFSETYRFKKPMNGYEGFSGAYHCSFVKVPKTVCSSNGRCQRIWELTQNCQ